jgi:ParB/RepB/Spo0J family partition protein
MSLAIGEREGVSPPVKLSDSLRKIVLATRQDSGADVETLEVETAPAVSQETPLAPNVKPNRNGKSGRKAQAQATASAAVAGIVPPNTPVEQIPLDRIDVLPGNPDPDPDVIREILQHGQDEPVILIAPGQLAPGDKLPHAWQTNHYLLVAGATRLAAAQQAGWPTIEARVRTEPISYADAIAFALRSNTGRRQVTTDELANRVQQLAHCGLDDAAIAERIDRTREEINQLRRFCVLPKVWQQRVRRFERSGGDDPDSLSWAAAKALLPYANVQPVLDDLERQWSSEDHQPRTRDAFRDAIVDAVKFKTRPVEPAAKFFDHEAYREIKVPANIDQLPEADRERLQIVELPIGERGRKEPRATCDPKTYCEILGIKNQQRGKTRGDDAGDAKPAAKKPKLSPAEQRARDKQADDELRDRIRRTGGLLEIGMRITCALSPRLKPGSEQARLIWRCLAACARDDETKGQLDVALWEYLATEIWAARRKVKVPAFRDSSYGRKREAYNKYFGYWATLEDSITAEDEQHVIAIQILLWPRVAERIDDRRLTKPGDWPERFPAIDTDLLTRIRQQLQVGTHELWKFRYNSEGGQDQWHWLERLLRAHDRRQLGLLAKECLTFDAACQPATLAEFRDASKTDQMACLLDAHRRGKFALPKVLSR